jgi:hypothetical protein
VAMLLLLPNRNPVADNTVKYALYLNGRVLKVDSHTERTDLPSALADLEKVCMYLPGARAERDIARVNCQRI